MTTIQINALGQPCPMPVVRAKQALSKLPEEGGMVEILVDNRTATENLLRLAQSGGYEYAIDEQGTSQYAVRIVAGPNVLASEAARPAPAPDAGGAVVAIGREMMGSGDDALGKILIKGYIFALTQLPVPPRAVLMLNGGVRLALEGANTVDDLRALERMGCQICLCGTCVDYYGVRDSVAVGNIVNMMDIATWMHAGAPVINL